MFRYWWNKKYVLSVGNLLKSFYFREIKSYLADKPQIAQRKAVLLDEVEKDCGDRLCTSEIRFLPTCVMYLDISESEKCLYPCSTTGCIAETHHFINCPTWTCYDKTTTTVSPDPTSKPAEPLPQCSTPLCISSVTLNVLIFLACGTTVAVVLWRRSRINQNLSFENSTFPDNFDLFVNQDPIIRNSSERLPLLALRSSPQQQQKPFAVESDRFVSTSVPNPQSNLLNNPHSVYQETTF